MCCRPSLSVGFPNVEALIADVEKETREPLDEIEKEVDRLADEAPGQVDEWKKKLADQRDFIARELETLRQRVARARPGFRRYKLLMRIYAVLTATVLIMGEVSALNTVAQGSYKHAKAGWAFGAVVLGLVAVTLAAIRRTRPEF